MSRNRVAVIVGVAVLAVLSFVTLSFGGAFLAHLFTNG